MTRPVLIRSAWDVVQHPRGDYLRTQVGETTVYADAHLGELEVAPFGLLTPEESRTLAARLTEGAAFAEGGPA